MGFLGWLCAATVVAALVTAVTVWIVAERDERRWRSRLHEIEPQKGGHVVVRWDDKP